MKMNHECRATNVLWFIWDAEFETFAAFWPKMGEYEDTETPFVRKFLDGFWYNFCRIRQIDAG